MYHRPCICRIIECGGLYQHASMRFKIMHSSTQIQHVFVPGFICFRWRDVNISSLTVFLSTVSLRSYIIPHRQTTCVLPVCTCFRWQKAGISPHMSQIWRITPLIILPVLFHHKHPWSETSEKVVKVASGVVCGGVEWVGLRRLVLVYPHSHGGWHSRSFLE